MKYVNYMLILILGITIIFSGCIANDTNKDINTNLIKEVQINQNQISNLELNQNEINALNFAINDEYKARAVYQKVIDKFGQVKPFSNIILAESQHISELEVLFNKYKLEIPQDDWDNKVNEYSSVSEACSVGVTAEIENADLYDVLLKDITRDDIRIVFIALRDASRIKHLPAFERCGNNN